MFRSKSGLTLRRARLTPKAARPYARASSKTAGPSTQYLLPTHPEDPASLPGSLHSQVGELSKYTVNTYARPPLVFTHGVRSTLYTSNPPREYLDFSAGIAVNALGHSDPGFIAVLSEQASKLMHASNVFWNEWVGETARLLVMLTKREGGMGWAPDKDLVVAGRDSGPGTHLWEGFAASPSGGAGADASPSGAKVFFSNSGTEANEGALKFARKYGKELWAKQNPGSNWEDSPKTRFLCFENSFHGRSMGALSGTTNKKYQAPFEPLIPGFDVGKVNTDEAIEMITENHCGVIVEPVQGEGGVFEAQEPWLRKLRERCTQMGAVLIYDEIQCGLFRTGTMWAHSALAPDCHPDIVTMAKALGNGYPVGGIMVRDSVAEAVTVGSHGTTSGGNVMAARLAHYILTRISSADFLAHLSRISLLLDERLSHLPTYFPTIVSPARGRGAMRGLPFKDPAHPARLVALARERGVLLLTAGKDAVRLVPSLNVSEAEVRKALDVIESCLSIIAKEFNGV